MQMLWSDRGGITIDVFVFFSSRILSLEWLCSLIQFQLHRTDFLNKLILWPIGAMNYDFEIFCTVASLLSEKYFKKVTDSTKKSSKT